MRRYYTNKPLLVDRTAKYFLLNIFDPMEVQNELGLRVDGRLPCEIRRVDICYLNEPSIVYTQGLTKIRVSIAGPKPKSTKFNLNITVSINRSARTEINEWGRLADDHKHRLHNLFKTILILKPASSVDIDILVLEDNGSLYSAMVNSVSVCCAYAGIQMLDLVLSCSIGIYTQADLFDLCGAEEDCKLPSFTICYGTNRKTLFGTSLVGSIAMDRIPNLLNSAVNCIELLRDRVVPSLKNLK
ncbi:Exosomal 3'-5' exoribonuclease complex, subunit Rrp41 [Trachipleistophora hominis]|uniref:Exosomal 3'-5' exoribonuclease complex, subunit Rrp41 n=1 Tax=Trachipleistophora hominis TaxID=72359 RepID=L7JWB1_TRAHO|nr:Exosomal 3'-5' exoribonuclease complex, subunit Rrp41 [Trachipleistophora hominis]